MKKIWNVVLIIILTILITLCIMDYFYDIPIIHHDGFGIMSGIIAIFLNILCLFDK